MNGIEHLVFLTNEDGEQAKVAMLRVQGTKQDALRIAGAHGFRNFNLIEQCDSADGYSEQRVATMRKGVMV